MDPSEYLVECLIRERLAEARAAAARSALARSLPPRRPARIALGRALIRIGHWMIGPRSSNASELPSLARSGESSDGRYGR